jgi:hypothetical protein
VPIFKQIALLLGWVERWKVGDFVCKKVGIEWEWESSGELRYLAMLGTNSKMKYFGLLTIHTCI